MGYQVARFLGCSMATPATQQPSNPATLVTIPNILTILRFFMIPVFLVASFEGAFGVAFGIFIAAAVTDILDGVIARRFNQRSRIGAILDPTADKILIVCGFLYYTLATNLP